MHAVAAAAGPQDLAGRPTDAAAAARLQDVGRLLAAPTAEPALLLAAVVHAELMAAEPFATHNGLVARAAERLVLVSRGLDEKSLVVPEAGHLALRAEYESNLRAFRDGGPAGSTPGCCTPPRRTPWRPRPAPSRAEHRPDMRATPDSQGDRMPPLTREAVATRRATSNCCLGSVPVARAL